jgi:hypothetical protein
LKGSVRRNWKYELFKGKWCFAKAELQNGEAFFFKQLAELGIAVPVWQNVQCCMVAHPEIG